MFELVIIILVFMYVGNDSLNYHYVYCDHDSWDYHIGTAVMIIAVAMVVRVVMVFKESPICRS
jgi:hypothetical protein